MKDHQWPHGDAEGLQQCDRERVPHGLEFQRLIQHAEEVQCAVANSLGNRRTFASHLFRFAGESLANASHA